MPIPGLSRRNICESMNPIPTRRHQRWHEVILLSRWSSLFGGWLFAIVLPASLLWGAEVLTESNTGRHTAVLAASLAYAVSHWLMHALQRFPGARSAVHIPPQVLLTFGVCTLATLLLRVDMSRLLMAVSAGLTLVWCYGDFALRRRYQQPKLAIVPFGMAPDLLGIRGIDPRPLEHPRLDERRYDGVVADLDAIPDEHWERFLAQCALARVPVYHARQVFESLTGRVRINHISENEMGALLPSPAYERAKYVLDVVLILLSLPISIPLGLATALCIRLESRGPVIFVQERVGKGNRSFRIYKFRSMVTSSEDEGNQFAAENDSRVTRVGRVIRKLHIDEIPQFINVLKGDMSLIGPRPEQRAFVDCFERDIPFYSYRHVVRPGITGWAQVTQGYVENTDGTRLKIEHDFFYIKHCSLALDFLIMLKTVRAMLTGAGAH